MGRQKAVIVMAAGRGTRMKSEMAKVLHPIAGRPMIHYPVRSALELGAERVVLILGHQRERVEAYLNTAFAEEPVTTALQAEQLGTAHAVLCGQTPLADFEGDVFILSGDVPTLPTSMIQRLDEETGDAKVGVVAMRLDEPGAYGRMITNDNGGLEQIVEAVDCTAEQRAVCEVNAGIYRVDAQFLFRVLSGLKTDNAQGEYYLTDLVEVARKEGHEVKMTLLTDDEALLAEGVNDRIGLAAAEGRMQTHLRRTLMIEGATLIDPERVYLHDGVTVGSDTVIEPDVSLLGNTHIGAGCILEQGARLLDTTVGDGTIVKAWSNTERTQIGKHCQVGPFARLREGTELGDTVKVGNFVETKKAKLSDGAKASHLSYIGDAFVGEGANIGAGTITCNYDGVNKFKTHIGAGAFIGSDTQLVAPVRVGNGAFVAAGTTVTASVPDDGLALSRAPQKNIEGWARRRRAQLENETKD